MYSLLQSKTWQPQKMGFKMVYQTLREIFPQIDVRVLRAVAIEHSKDADLAVEVVLSEIVPRLPLNLRNDTRILDDASHTIPDEDAEHETEDSQLRNRFERGLSKSNRGTSSVGFSVESPSSSNAHNDELVLSGKAPEKDTEEYEYASLDAIRADTQTEKLVQVGESNDCNTSAEIFHLAPTAIAEKTADLTLEVVEDGVDNQVFNQTESSTNATVLRGENAAGVLIDANPQEHVSDVEQFSGYSFTGCETSKGLVSCENSNAQGEAAFNTIVTRSGQVCNVDLLEDIIADAKSNKKTLLTVVESVMNLIREVEAKEKAAEQAKEEADRGGLDILGKVEELKLMLAHAKEANDMHAGEVYGEKSILGTELRELQIRLFNLSEERDNSLSILTEMRETLEARLVAAEEMNRTAEQEKQEKEESAKKSLAEQEAIMEKIVQESKMLQQAAEENSKLREFLMDRGQTVDSLQGEISVICQDVRLLKEKFDERVPLSQSITSSQTSCRLASSGSSSLKNSYLDISLERPRDLLKVSDKKNSKPSLNTASLNGSLSSERKESVDYGWDGWDIFDKDTELGGHNLV